MCVQDLTGQSIKLTLKVTVTYNLYLVFTFVLLARNSKVLLRTSAHSQLFHPD